MQNLHQQQKKFQQQQQPSQQSQQSQHHQWTTEVAKATKRSHSYSNSNSYSNASSHSNSHSLTNTHHHHNVNSNNFPMNKFARSNSTNSSNMITMTSTSSSRNNNHYISTSTLTPTTTWSKAILQNNIGALLLFKGSSISLAKEKFYAAFQSSIINTGNAASNAACSSMHTNDNSDSETEEEAEEKIKFDNANSTTSCTLLHSRINKILQLSSSTTSSTTSSTIQNNGKAAAGHIGNNKNNDHIQGLTWFHNRLLREVTSKECHNHSSSTSSSSSCTGLDQSYVHKSSFTTATPSSSTIPIQKQQSYHDTYTNNTNTKNNHNHTKEKNNNNNHNNIVNDGDGDGDDDDLFIYHSFHSTSTNHHYHIVVNEDIPLGLEYIHDPIICQPPINGYDKKKKSNDNVNDNDDVSQHYCEMNVRLAAGINLALCIWSSSNSNNNNDNNDGTSSSSSSSSRTDFRIQKAKMALQILETLLEYVQEEQNHSDHNNKNNNQEKKSSSSKPTTTISSASVYNFTQVCKECKRMKEFKLEKERIEKRRREHVRSSSWANVVVSSSSSLSKNKTLYETTDEKNCDERKNDSNDDNGNNTASISNHLSSQSSSSPSSLIKPLTSCPDPSLLIIVHNNIGVLSFTLNQTKKALYHFEQAKSLLSIVIRNQFRKNRQDDYLKQQQQQQQQQQKDQHHRQQQQYRMRNDSSNFATVATTRSRSSSIVTKSPLHVSFSETMSIRRSNSTDTSVPIRPSSSQTLSRRELFNQSRLRSNSLSSSSFPNALFHDGGHSSCNGTQSHHPQHHQTLLPSINYLQLTTILNLTRTTLRMNAMLEHSKILCNELNYLITTMTTTDIHPASSSWNQLQHVSSRSIFGFQQRHNLNSSTSSSIHEQHKIKWLITIATNYIPGLLQQRLEHYTKALEHYNSMLSHTRKELGHDHVFVAMILEKKGNVLFDQRKCQTAMLSYLASLRIYEHQDPLPFMTSKMHQQQSLMIGRKNQNQPDTSQNGYQLEQSKLLYAIGRTLHDREEFADALNMYQKALAFLEMNDTSFKKGEGCKRSRAILLDSIQIMCNIGRIHQIMGDLDQCLDVNLRIVETASEMVGDQMQVHHIDSNTFNNCHPVLHPFVRNRLMVVGNVYVEMGRLDDAMKVFAKVARGSGEEGTDWMVSHLRPEVEDVDTNAFAVRAAERLGKIGARSMCPHSAAA